METPETIGRRILIVDDEVSVGEAIRRILELDKHTVQTVVSAQQALTLMQTNKFDVIIIDYEMPDMKGDKLAAAIRAREPRQPIVMVTAYGESLRAAGEFPLAVDLVMNKPFDSKDLRGVVRQLAIRP